MKTTQIIAVIVSMLLISVFAVAAQEKKAEDVKPTLIAANPNADGKQMTYGQCVTAAADVKKTCYGAQKEAEKACKGDDKNKTAFAACKDGAKNVKSQCKDSFKSAKNECKKIKHNFFETMRYSLK